MIKLIKQIYDFLKKIKPYFYPGLILFLLMFIFSNYINFSSTYMGNKVDSVIELIYRKYLLTIIIIILKILFIYLLTGCITSAVFYRASLELKKRCGFKFSPFWPALAGLSIYAFLLFSEKIIINPQLYSECFETNAKILGLYQKYLTNSVPPQVFGVLLILFTASVLYLFIISFNLKNVLSAILNRLKMLRFKKTLAACVLTALLLYIIFYAAGLYNRNDTRHPNIIILSSDALRPDHFSCNGYKRDTTPNIDRIAGESLQVRGVITTVPRTFPAWVSILTSQYPLTNNIKHMFPRTAERNLKFNTAPRHLGELGYKTAVISDFGGDIFPRLDFGFSKTSAPDLNFIILLKQIILEKQTLLLPFITNSAGMAVFPEMRGIAKHSIPETVTEETLSQIKSAGGKPFFIVVFHSVTHFPFSAPYPYYKKYSNPGYNGPFKYLKERVIKISGGSSNEENTIEDEKQAVALYDGCLNLFDREVGEIYDYLADSGLLKNTIVVITSDHGENLYEPGLGLGHGEHLKSNYPIEVPLIIHSEKLNSRKGEKIFRPSSTIDIMPTVFYIAGIATPVYFEGTSILNDDKNRDRSGINAYSETGIWFDNNKSSPLFFNHMRIDYPDITGISEIDFIYRDEVVIQQKFQNIVNAAKYRSIYSGRYKLIYIPLRDRPRFELYDYLADPDNTNDLSGKNRDALEMMKAKFYKFIDEKSAGNFIIKNGLIIPVFSDPVF